MRVLAIIGSPRLNGFTAMTVRALEREMIALDPSVDFETIHLSQVNLDHCKGCFQCLAKGEERCPLKDDRDQLESAMREADGVIFASPVYVCNVSGIMKNFIDRFAYRCHRPDFNGKKAMTVATTGGIGLGIVNFILKFTVETWGFSVVQKLGLAYDPTGTREDAVDPGKQKAIAGVARAYLARLKDPRPSKPGLLKVIGFKLQRKSFSKAPKDSPDYRFWLEKGWFDRKCGFYYPVRVGWMKKIIASMINPI